MNSDFIMLARKISRELAELNANTKKIVELLEAKEEREKVRDDNQ